MRLPRIDLGGQRLLAGAILAAAMLLGGSIVFAAIPSRDGVIHGCYSKKTGALRIIDRDRGKRCKRSERSISWNRSGAPGPRGEGGPAGEPGAAGAQGAAGAPGQLAVADPLQCPAAPACGNTVVEAGEDCDQGDTLDGDGCGSTCQTEAGGPACGDSTVDPGETCDDGDTDSGDGCSSTCQTEPTCGNGITDAGEECDDGNAVDTDGCSNTCQLPGAAAEICNGQDDDGDSQIDEDYPDLGNACDGGDSDLCGEGARQCSVDGQDTVCSDSTSSTLDTCGGGDEDCDPASADGSEDPLVGISCDGPDGDACNEGARVCTGGALTCSDTTPTSIEVCNGFDDDCDGVTDEGCP